MQHTEKLPVIELAKRLIGFDSSSNRSNTEIAAFTEELLVAAGFETERIEYEDDSGTRKVSLVARKGTGPNGFAFCGHLDTVPAGDGWQSDPFSAVTDSGRLYGRGSCDMKGAVAAMVCAAREFAAAELSRPLYFLLSSDEEMGFLGAKQMMSRSRWLRESPPVCGVIGEPTSLQVVNAHKGVIQFHALARGTAAHSSTGKGVNANLKMIPFLHEMCGLHRMLTTDERYFNRDFDPPFSDWNITMGDGGTAANVTAPLSRSVVNYRPLPGQDADALVARVLAAAETNGVEVDVRHFARPFVTPADTGIVRGALKLTGQPAAKAVSFTAEGVVFAPLMDLILLGPGDIAQAHTVGEWVAVEQLCGAAELYRRFIQEFCVICG